MSNKHEEKADMNKPVRVLRVLLIASALAALGGCVAVPAQPGYYEPAPVVYVPAPVYYGPPLVYGPTYFGPSIHLGYSRGWGGRGYYGGHGRGRR